MGDHNGTTIETGSSSYLADVDTALAALRAAGSEVDRAMAARSALHAMLAEVPT